jgi:predicted phosphoadenosine phosphosulfate sulfurtransferase
MAMTLAQYSTIPQVINTNQMKETVAVRTKFLQFTMADVEDPILYAASPVHEWQQTDMGKWCMDHAIGETTLYTQTNYATYGVDAIVMGYLSEEDYTLFKLKWG